MYCPIQFLVKNELQKNSLSLRNSEVVIGECEIPLNVLYSSEYKQDNCIELNLIIKLRRNNIIGDLRVLIAFSNTPFNSSSEALKIVRNKEVNLNNDLSMNLNSNCLSWDKDYLNRINTFF